MAINFQTTIIDALYAGSVAAEPAYQSPGTFGIPASYVASGSVSSIAVTAAGGGYTTVVPTITVTGDGTGATATARMKLLSIAPLVAGTGYVTGDTVTLGGGTFTTAAVVRVIASAGAITGISEIVTPGVYSVIITTGLTAASTSGVGINATFQTALWGVTSIVIGAGGSNYTTAAAAASLGTGTGVLLTPQINPAGSATASTNEQGLLTMIELMRGYFALIGSAQEARFANTVLRKMLAELQQSGGASTYSAANNATRAQTEAMRFYAKRIRNPNL